MTPRVSRSCCCRTSGRRATARAGASAAISPRGLLFGGIGVVVCGALFAGAFWLTTQLADYEEFGDYLLRLGLSWLFLTFLSFLAFSGVVTALSTFFLSDDCGCCWRRRWRRGRLFLARFARTVGQASWMVVVFLAPVLVGVGVGALRAAGVLRDGRADGRAVRRSFRSPSGRR